MSLRFLKRLNGTSRRRNRFVPALAASLLLSLMLIGGAIKTASADTYTLGPEDKVKIRVYEWRPSRDAVFAWKALNEEFIVSPDGRLSLPLAGEVQAQGRTISQVAEAIGQQLKANLGLGRSPDVSVDISEFRPFYVTGQVARAGAFPYRPGLTVLQAVSIAGGLPTGQEGTARFGREAIQGRGDISVFRMYEVNLLAKKARLEAELSGADSIRFPDRLEANKDDPLVKTAIDQERLVFKARNEGMKTQVRALHDLQDFLDKETVTLGQQLALLDKQINSLQKELGSVSKLVSKGLAAAPREFNLDRQLAQAQSDRLSAETSLLRAKQEISRTNLSLLELQDGRRNEATNDLRQTQSALEENERKEATARQLLYDSEVTSPKLFASHEVASRAAPVYTIFRRAADGKMTTIDAQETTSVQPGDTVRVVVPPPPDTDVGRPAASGASADGLFSPDGTSSNGLAMK